MALFQRPFLEDPPARRALLLTAFISIGILFSYAFQVFSADDLEQINDSLTVLVIFLGIIFSLFLLINTRPGETARKIWGGMTLGLALWGVGELIWLYYVLIGQEDAPYPSLADVVFVAGYIPLLLSLYIRFQTLRVSRNRSFYAIVAGAFAVSIVFLVLFAIAPILTSPDKGSAVELALDLIYPIGSGMLLLGALVITFSFWGGGLSLPWQAITTGLALLASSDLLFTYATWNDLYRPEGSLNFLSAFIDVTYLTGYLFWVFGLFAQLRYQRVAIVNTDELPVDTLPPEMDDLSLQTPAGSTSTAPGFAYLIFTEAEGKIVFVEEDLTRLLGYDSPGELVGETILELVQKNDRQIIHTILRDVKNHGYIRNQSIRLARGSFQTGFLTGTAVYSDEGLYLGADFILSHSKANQEASSGGHQDSLKLLFKKIIAQVMEIDGTRSAAERDLARQAAHLKAYFTVVASTLYALLIRTGGKKVAQTAEDRLNATAKRIGAFVMMKNGQLIFMTEPVTADQYRVILDELIGYAENVLSIQPVLHELQLLVDHIHPETIQIVEQAGFSIPGKQRQTE